MERRQLGKTGLRVPVIGLGTWRVFNVRDDAGEARCEAVADAAIDAGANFFDTSPMYGEAERVLGLVIADRREEAIVTTKVWARVRAVGEQQIEQAIGWFERVDLYLVHNLLALRDHLPALRELRDRGLVGAVGGSQYLPSAYPELIELMRDGTLDAVEIPYHPLEREAEEELLPAAEEHDIGVIAMRPFGSGALLANPPSPEDLAPLAEFGIRTWPQALLKWLLSDRRVHVAIPATSSADHMRENAEAGGPPWLGEAERERIRELAVRAAR
jgi:aryl-alcohol dehydrogenase-like predicted oxidoreductase